MKNLKFAFLLAFIAISATLFSQGSDPWTSKDLIEPDALAGMLSNSKSQKPVIFNIGPLANIKGAVTIGSTNTKANLDKLSKALATVPKDKMVVIYCGCCPFRNCPNIRPAFNMLKDKGFKKPRLLNLKQNLKVNWTDFGYPME
jgi:hypothetical protein